MSHEEDEPAITPPAGTPPAGGPARPAASRGAGHSLHLVLLATVGLLLARLPLIPRRTFDPDEFEHSHAAWCLFKGMVPYKDFFEHHTPAYYYVLRPFFNWFDVETSFESATHFLFLGRALSLILTAVSVLLLVLMGRVGRADRAERVENDRRVGPVAGLLLVSQPLFLQKTLEMRPDVLALPLFLGGLWLLLRALARDPHSRISDLWCFLGAGLGFGMAIMCTQKMLFALPGVMAGLGFWALTGRWRSRARSIGALLLGICVPGVATWAAFVAQGAGKEFIANNFLLNASWKHVPTGQFFRLMVTSLPVLALSLVGIAASLRRLYRSEARRYGEFMLATTMIGLFAGVLVIPVAQRQYYLMPLPIACLFAAQGLFILVDRGGARVRRGLLLLAAVLLSVLPSLALREAFATRNDLQLARLRHVFVNTKPTDLVMDGWEGTGVFRPHAFYYFFIHGELLPMLSHARLDAFLDDLESGRVRPRLISIDIFLVALGPRFRGIVQNQYASGDGSFYFPRAGTAPSAAPPKKM